MVLQTVRLLKEKGKSNLVKGILIPEGAGTSFAASGTSPQDYNNIPFLLANGDYRPATTRQVNRDFFAQLSQARYIAISISTVPSSEASTWALLI